MNGPEMLLVNMLKAFMPREAADKIYGMATDGTFDRIGAIPSELDAIKKALQDIQCHLIGIERALRDNKPEDRDGIQDAARIGILVASASSEHRANGTGASAGSSGVIDTGHGGSVVAVGEDGG
jgi:hypothetical protein